MMGYAVLLYDKRGTGDATGAPWSSATFDDLAGDMLAAVALLKKHPDIDAKKIGLQGNSQAGWVIPLATVASNDVRFVIIASGGGITNSDTDIHEARYYIQESKLPAADADELLNYVKAKWNYALTETGWDAYEIALKKAQGKTWLLNFGGPAVKDPKAWRKIGLHKDKDLEAEKTIAQIKVPILLLYGEPALDEHMPVIDSIKGWENAFKMSGNKDHEIKKLSGVGHSVFLAIANGKSVINQEAFTAVKDWLAVHLKPLQ